MIGLIVMMSFFSPLSPAETREAPVALTRKEAETRARTRSPRLQAVAQDVAAAVGQSDSQYATLFPKLSLDASYRYNSIVPEIRTGAGSTPLGDHKNYSIGPTLTYTLFDQGSGRNLYRSFESLRQAKEQDHAAAERQVLLATRQAYVQAQLAQREVELVEQSLQFARRQYADISARYRAGSASRIDLLNAEREVSSFELREAQGKSELDTAFTELRAWVGPFGGVEVKLDALEAEAVAQSNRKLTSFGVEHPQLRAQHYLAETAELAADGVGAGRWPLIQLQARTSLDYPNGPNLERIHQNSVGISLSWALLDWGRAGSAADQKRAEALGWRFRRDQAQSDLERDWEKAENRLEHLKQQRESAGKNVRLSESLVQLSEQSYRAGRVNLLDVQSANLKWLEAQVQGARIDAQTLMQIYQLEYLAKESP
ncbi:MAG: TolC family protein [Bacteriovoracia bacterium]